MPEEKTGEPGAKRKVKDSVFTHLFREEKYQRWLCHDLYGDSVRNIELITADWVFCNGLYNDLGLLADGRLILMVEAQSTWSVNICLRMLVYLAETYVRYVRTHDQLWFSRAKVFIPVPDLYVIYTGSWDGIPDTLSLKDEFFDGKGNVDLVVKILKPTSKDDILWQYTEFCRTFDDYRRAMPRNEALKMAIERCKENGILADYLTEHGVEVIPMMDYIFSQESANEFRYEEGMAKGKAEGKEEGKEEKAADIARNLLEMGMTVEFITKCTGLPADSLKSLASSMGIRSKEGTELFN